MNFGPSPNLEVPVPIVDSILGPAALLLVKGLEAINLPYRMQRIPRMLPLVLRELKLKGLHHYVAHRGRFNYEQAQSRRKK